MGIYRKRTGLLLATPAIFFLLVLIIYPILYNLWVSLYDVNYFTGKFTFIGLKNYTQELKNPAFWKAFYVDVLWTIGSVFGQLFFGLVAALLINKDVKGISFFRTALLIPYILPIVSTTLTWKWVLNDLWGIISYWMQQLGMIPPDSSPLGDIDLALPFVIIISIWRFFPFAMITYWGALRAIPKEEYEASAIDGASSLHTFLYITLPHLKGSTLVLLILRSIWTFNYYDLIYLLTSGGPAQATTHLPILIYQRGMGQFKFGSAAAIAIMSGMIFIVLAIAYLKIQDKEDM